MFIGEMTSRSTMLILKFKRGARSEERGASLVLVVGRVDIEPRLNGCSQLRGVYTSEPNNDKGLKKVSYLGSFRSIFTKALPGTSQVANPFHENELANLRLDECRRRDQIEREVIWGWIQGVSATSSVSLSSGFKYPKVARGRPLRLRWMRSKSSAECRERSLPLGRYRRSNPLVFSFEPRATVSEGCIRQLTS